LLLHVRNKKGSLLMKWTSCGPDGTRTRDHITLNNPIWHWLIEFSLSSFQRIAPILALNMCTS
jgi:hypothetical protein